MIMTRPILLVVFFLMARVSELEAGAAGNKLSNAKELEGVWRVVKAQDTDGLGAVLAGKLLVVSADVMQMYDKKVDDTHVIPTTKMFYRLNAGKSPMEIDLFSFYAGRKAEVPMLGIITASDNRMSITWNMRAGRPRPTNFAINEDDPVNALIWLTLERVPSKKK
jgi:uncharacterized protein (TIGR03067 family)